MILNLEGDIIKKISLKEQIASLQLVPRDEEFFSKKGTQEKVDVGRFKKLVE